MPNQRAILCGNAGSGNLPLDDPEPLRLSYYGSHANVHLRIEDVRHGMWHELPPLFEDLIDIATYVYAADQAVRRGGNGVDDFGGSWRRELFFRIPVREPAFWSQKSVLGELVSVLSFLSEDCFNFEFVPNENPSSVKQKLLFSDDPFSGLIEEAVLFSGGLDSLAGAIQECLVDKRRTLLVNHRSTEKLTRRHRRLLEMLVQRTDNNRPIHIPVRINKVKDLSYEYTQRTRSFLYASLAATLASGVGLNRIRFYENGVVGLNLPLSGQVVGARATRTTHPRVLKGFESLFSAVAGKKFIVENKFLWKTKSDIVQLIAEHGCSEMIRWATTCMHTWGMRKDQTHCGSCSQCIDRRFAVLAAGQANHDPADAYKVDLLTGERAEGEPKAMLAAYVETANQMEHMDSQTFFETFGETFRVLKHVDGSPEAVAMEIFRLHQRHAKQVVGVIDAAIAKYSSAIRKRELPPNCLLRLVADASSSQSSALGRNHPGLSGHADNVFQKKGQVWQVRFAGGEDFILLPSKGAAYLNILLANPGRQLSAVDLAWRVARNPNQYELGSAGPKSDEEALQAYAARLFELQDDLEEAKRHNDIGRQETIERETEVLRKELKACKGLGRQVREASDDRDRIRKAVGNAVRRAIKEIAQYDSPLAAHLKSHALHLGMNPRYEPTQAVVWDA